MPRYDTAVIGSGPAGLEAALNLKIRNKDFLLFGTGALSGKLEAAPRIDNYLGLPGISGKELADRFRDHLRQMGIAILPEKVSTVYPMGGYYSLAAGNGIYEVTTVILATGAFHASPLPGEERLLGRGVGYCATCDAPLYRGKTVAVLGWSEEAVREANFIAEICGTVYYLPMKPAEEKLDPGIRLIGGKAPEILGDSSVSGLLLEDGPLPVDAVFLLREAIAPDALVPGIALQDGFIQVDSEMRTNLPGCFAAGDCTGKPHQYMRAAGQGQTAALNAAAYIDIQKRK